MEVIKITDLCKEYPGVKALAGVSFSVKKGSIHGFLGPNGAGKSTTMKIITGLIPAGSGTVEVLGMNIEENMDRVKSSIGFLPENPPLYFNMTVEDYLQFVAEIHGVASKESKQRVHDIINRCGLFGVEKRLIGNLSKGYKQRVAIAQALVFKPEIIILDEPTVGLDPSSIAEIRELIKSLQHECTVLLSTHQLHEASKLCSDITIINDGKIGRTGSLAEIEHMFKTKQVLFAEVRNWNEQLKDKMIEQFSLEGMEVLPKESSFYLECFSNDTADIRSEVSRFLFQNGCDLLYFKEDRPDLEEIFKQIVGGEQ